MSKAKEIQLIGEGKRYFSMVEALLSDPKVAKCLAEVTQPSVHDKLSGALVNISYELGASLSIIRALINLEFDRKWQHPTTILRVNSIVSKMTGKYTNKVGDEYIRKVLGDLILDINAKPELRLDPNPNNIKEGDVEAISAQALKDLEEYCQTFFDKITNKESIQDMPRELRAICYFIESAGDKYKLEKETTVYPLISGFVMLRYLCPAITLPQLSGILPKLPEGDVRQNLTNIAKIVQKLANQEKFDVETPHLMGLNDFIERNKSKLINYLKALAADPWGKNYEDFTQPVNFEMLHLQNFSLDELKAIHGYIYDTAYDLQTALMNESMTGDQQLITLTDQYVSMILELGVPEGKGKVVTSDKDVKDAPKKKETIDGKTPDEVEASLIKKALDFVVSKIKLIKLSELENSKLFYLGKPAKDKSNVLYFIMHRLDKKYFASEGLDVLMIYILTTLLANAGSAYSLVVDMSWTKLEDEFGALVTKGFTLLNRFLQKETFTNLNAVWTVQPTAKNVEFVNGLLTTFDEDIKKKIKQVWDWRDLDSLGIEAQNIWLPFISKRFSPVSHIVTVTLGKDKKDVLLKVTAESVLIVDVKAGIVYREMQFSSMTNISYDRSTTTLKMQHIPAKKSLFSDPLDVTIKLKTDNDDGILDVVCTEGQAILITESILNCAGKVISAGGQRLTFKILKEAAEEKTFPRILKLTSDSILNFSDQKVIKSEIPYSTIQSFYVDPQSGHRLIINFLANGEKRSYVIQTKKAPQIREAIYEAIFNFKWAIKLDIDLYKSIKIEQALVKFYAGAVKAKLTDYASMSFNVEGVMKAFKDMFSKFATDKNNRCPFNEKRLRTYVDSIKCEMTDSEITCCTNIFDPSGNAATVRVARFVDLWCFARRGTLLLERRTKMLEERKKVE